jgi:uncharacterized protein involved in exopolysaccharide biosynthesis
MLSSPNRAAASGNNVRQRMPNESDEPKNSPAWVARLARMSPVRAFATVFLSVFLFIFLGSVLMTWMMPETYRATARVVAPDAANLLLFQSTELLKEVSQHLNLPERFAARYGESKPIDDRRVEDMLRRSVQVRRVPGTDLLEIRVYSRSPAECSEWANEIAEIGARQARSVRIAERAVPPFRPSRPNKLLNFFLGAVVGIFLGTMAGGVGAKLAVGFDGRQ